MNPIKAITLSILLSATAVFAEEAWYSVYFPAEGIDYEFSGIRISAVSAIPDNVNYSPVSEDGGWYNGFSGAAGYKVVEPWWNATSIESEDGVYFTNISMDASNMANYYFLAELLSDTGDVVGYSGYSDYADVNRARKGVAGFRDLNLGSFTAAPVPEPTSGLLLLLGGALLGLRRKRRVA